MCTYGEERPQFGEELPGDSMRRLIAAAVMPHYEEPADNIEDWAWAVADSVVVALNLTEFAGVIIGCAHG